LPPFHWWRTVFFLIPAIGIYTVVLGIISMFASLVGNPFFAHRCAQWWGRLIVLTSGVRLQVGGAPLPASHDGCIVVANHASIYDIPVLFTAIPRQLRLMAKSALGFVPFIGWHLKFSGHLLVDRRNPTRALNIFSRASKLMTQGLCLIVFPEGTRSRDGRVAPFKGGSFFLALRTGLPVVPLSVVGSRHVMLKGRLATCPGHVRLIVHEPIDTHGLVDADPAAARRFAARVHDVIAPAAESDVDRANQAGSRQSFHEVRTGS
jgi:1-acyl-sn-glycerol-3-phosphate acyltransferase